MERATQELHDWVTNVCLLDATQLKPLAGDASFRRYYRLQSNDRSYVVMDASKERASCIPFSAIAKSLRHMGLITPEVFAHDFEQGFLLLSDLGDAVYLKTLSADNAVSLYTNALDALALLQDCREIEGLTLPIFTADFMRQELVLFKEWFLERYLKLTLTAAEQNMLSDCFNKIAETAAQQTQVFMHRDYHSANLMVLPEQSVGILDFQDAFIGPVTYDLVSLLRDCYIAWPDEMITELVLKYREKITVPVSPQEFLRWFDWMGLQRHMKALLTFSRKYVRDQNSNYLQHIPRTLNYLAKTTARYPELQALHYFFQTISARVLCEP